MTSSELDSEKLSLSHVQAVKRVFDNHIEHRDAYGGYEGSCHCGWKGSPHDIDEFQTHVAEQVVLARQQPRAENPVEPTDEDWKQTLADYRAAGWEGEEPGEYERMFFEAGFRQGRDQAVTSAPAQTAAPAHDDHARLAPELAGLLHDLDEDGDNDNYSKSDAAEAIRSALRSACGCERGAPIHSRRCPTRLPEPATYVVEGGE